jgi:hypothetical protein
VLEIAQPPKPDEEGKKQTQQAEGEGGAAPVGVYSQQVWRDMENPEPRVEPSMQGGGQWEEIPFVTIGATDVTPGIDEIPLIGVARCAFNMYRLDTDYKWQLYMSGQETMFVYTNSEQPVKIVGAGVVINIPIGSKAEYIGPTCNGINAHKDAIADERLQAVIAGSRILDTEKRSAESGDALKIRWAAQTASLTTVALNSAKGLERALKFAARFIGANEEEVVVKPNLDFLENQLDPLAAKALMELWMGGAISRQTMYENFQRGGIASQDRGLAEEVDLIEAEIPDITTPAIETAPELTAKVPPTQQAQPMRIGTIGRNR